MDLIKETENKNYLIGSSIKLIYDLNIETVYKIIKELKNKNTDINNLSDLELTKLYYDNLV